MLTTVNARRAQFLDAQRLKWAAPPQTLQEKHHVPGVGTGDWLGVRSFMFDYSINATLHISDSEACTQPKQSNGNSVAVRLASG